MYLQGSGLSLGLSLTRLFDELTEELILKLRVGQTHLQSTLGQGDVVVNGRGIDGHIDKELARLEKSEKEIQG